MPDASYSALAPDRLDEHIEHLGVSIVRMQLQRDFIEVAEPARDRGIDLIAYRDRDEQRFRARPIQVKASAGTRWVHSEKYAAFPDLIIAHVMNAAHPHDAVVYALTYDENHAVARRMGYLTGKLWRDPPDQSGRRVWKQTASSALLTELEPYRVVPGVWSRLVAGRARRRARA